MGVIELSYHSVKIERAENSEMVTKLHIDIVQGVVIVEGEEEFVQSVYADFKERLLSQNLEIAGHVADANENEQPGGSESPSPRKTGSRRRKRSKPRSENSDAAAESYAPTLMKNLDLSGLSTFFEKFIPKNHAERVLIFAKYLDSIGHSPCTADQIYTCYMVLKERVPKVYVQALRDAHGRKYGFIDYKSPESISLTYIGENQFNHDLKLKEGNDE